MESEKLILLLKKYKSELEGILSRFSFKGKHIASGDESKLRTIVSELDDLFVDHLGRNKYSDSIRNSFNVGINNYYNTPSYNCVSDIISSLSPAITRIERNPEFLNKKEIKATTKKEITPLVYPEKMTVNWIKEHVPLPYIWSLVLLLFFVFSLGVTFANTALYKSLTDIEIAKDNKATKKTKNNEQRNTSKTPITLAPKS